VFHMYSVLLSVVMSMVRIAVCENALCMQSLLFLLHSR